MIELKENEDKIMNNLKLIESMAEKNSTEKQIAEEIGIPYTTFRRYKKNSEELKDALENGKNAKLQEVEQAVFKNAVGYHYWEQVATKLKVEVMAEDEKTVLVQERVKISDVKKYKGPDLAAEKYILNNHMKTKYKDDPHKVANDKKLTRLKEKEVNAKVIT